MALCHREESVPKSFFHYPIPKNMQHILHRKNIMIIYNAYWNMPPHQLHFRFQSIMHQQPKKSTNALWTVSFSFLIYHAFLKYTKVLRKMARNNQCIIKFIFGIFLDAYGFKVLFKQLDLTYTIILFSKALLSYPIFFFLSIINIYIFIISLIFS